MNKQKKSMDQNPGQLINSLIKMKTAAAPEEVAWTQLAADFSPSGLPRSVPRAGGSWLWLARAGWVPREGAGRVQPLLLVLRGGSRSLASQNHRITE